MGEFGDNSPCFGPFEAPRRNLLLIVNLGFPMKDLSRRRVLIGGLAAAAAGALPPLVRRAHAGGIALTATSRVIEVKGRAATVFGLSGPSGFGGLTFDEGERFRVGLTNALSEPTLIHWHGLTPPTEQDGVPGLSQPALDPHGMNAYDFENIRAGTHWMHSHVGLQEQSMLAAPLIIREREAQTADEQEHVLMLHDFTFRDPDEIMAELKAGKGAHAGHATPDMQGMDMKEMDHSGAAGDSAMLNDVAFDAYLANERTIDDPEVVRVERAGRVRLRIINAAAASNMWIDLGGLEGELIAVDGNPVKPVKGSRFPLAIAQRADIRLKLPSKDQAWPVLFRPEGVAAAAAIILATPQAAIPRMPEMEDVSPAVDLSLESRLEAAHPLRPEPVNRVQIVMLTGGGADYVWGLNGGTVMTETLFTVRSGERIAMMIHNMTTMAHPMHLHGNHFQVVAINGQKLNGAMRDTVLVPPSTAVTVAFAADNPGNWAFHCHHLYHMNAGMMGTIRYTTAA
jgi:FtsP/CotA-like multicopper oxidase with cupredoxin domain